MSSKALVHSVATSVRSAALLLALALASSAQAAADAGQDFARGAVGAFETCTPLGADGDTLCHDYIVEYFVEHDPSVGTACFTHFSALIHSDGTADEYAPEVGCKYPVKGSYDTARLMFARMDGSAVTLDRFDLSTGEITPNVRTVVLGPFTWTAASGIHVFGNDGPFGFPDLARRIISRCATQIYNANERFTAARVTGTIDGVSVSNYGPAYLPWPGTGPADAVGAVFELHLNIINAGHGNSC